jgi:hypothetical protein
MVAVNVGLFRGMSEKVSPRLLPEDMAVSVVNADLDSGTLRPIKAMVGTTITVSGPTLDAPNGSTKGLFQARDGSWFNFGAGVNVTAIDSPVAEDAYNRVYFSGFNAPRVTSTTAPTVSFPLGVPKANTPTQSISPQNSANEDTEAASSRSYVITQYTSFGEEGPPSNPTAILNVRSDQTVSITTGGASEGNRNIVYLRVYRTDANGSFRFLAQRSLAQASVAFDDTVLDSALGEELVSQDWDEPPENMQGLCAMANGICAGFVGQTVCFSEAFLPHAWPKRFQLTTQHTIKAIKTFETGLLVMTDGKPYIVQGADPAGMVMTELNVPYPISSPYSAVDMGGSVIYCSTDGLVSVSSSGASLVTEPLFSSDGWAAAHSPATVSGFLWKGKYVGFHETVSDINGFIFDPRGGKSAFTKHSAGEVLEGRGFSSSQDDELYVVVSGALNKFAAGTSYLNASWDSRHYYSDRPVNLGVAKVSFGENLGAGDTTISLTVASNMDTASDSIVHTKSIGASEPISTFRLPSGYKMNSFKVFVRTKREIHSITFAECPTEL